MLKHKVYEHSKVWLLTLFLSTETLFYNVFFYIWLAYILSFPRCIHVTRHSLIHIFMFGDFHLFSSSNFYFPFANLFSFSTMCLSLFENDFFIWNLFFCFVFSFRANLSKWFLVFGVDWNNESNEEIYFRAEML